MRNRIICLAIALCVLLALCACGSTAYPKTETQAPASESGDQKPDDAADPVEGGRPESLTSPAPAQENEDDGIDDEAWDKLASMGKIETENGLFYVSITLPADFVDEGVTQASIDANAGENYTSGKLNDDGSITYKMTKKQHKAMLDNMSQSIERSLQEMIDSPNYAFTKISHNDNYTSFDAHLSTEELGFAESFMVLGFYVYGGMYNAFTGQDVDNIEVNFYSPSGKLINTANSSDMQQ